jgi:hypothetical protein
MGLLLFSIDDDIDTDLDTPIWDGAFHDVMRYDALAREIEHLVARATVVPPCIGSLVLLAASLRSLAAGAANGTYRELFVTEGIVGGYLSAAYATARDAAAGAPLSFDEVTAAQKRLDAVADELPDELRVPVLETFVAFSRLRNDLA